MRRSPPPRRRLAVALASALALPLACAGEAGDSSGDTDTAGESIDEAKVVAEVLAFDQGDYTKVNTTPLTSQHAAATVDVWVPNALTDLYYQIIPGDPSSSATFPAGAILIKHHWTAGGASDGWTVMVKGAAGYDPDALGWWWARLLADGSFAGDGMTEYKGNVGFCVSCHKSGAATDYVRGIDPAAHAGP